MSQAVERWSVRSIWGISRADPAYPKRLKTRLKEDVPPLLYGCGDLTLLEKGGLAGQIDNRRNGRESEKYQAGSMPGGNHHRPAALMINEAMVEQAVLDWLKALGCEVLSGLAIAPGEPAAERSDYKRVFIFDRPQAKLEDLNPQVPREGLQETLRMLRLISHPTLIENNRVFHQSVFFSFPHIVRPNNVCKSLRCAPAKASRFICACDLQTPRISAGGVP